MSFRSLGVIDLLGSLSVSRMVTAAEAGLVVGEYGAFVANGIAIAPFTAGCKHGFLGTAFDDELFLNCLEELVYQVVRLLDKHETEVGKFDILLFCDALVDKGMKVGDIAVLEAEGVCPVEIFTTFLPNSLSSHSEIVGIVFVELCQTAFGDIDQLDHHFL